MNIKAYIVAGEVSGDNHGSGLMSEMINLCEGIEFYGMGGPSMANYSNRVQNWINESAVVGFWEVIKKYRYFSFTKVPIILKFECQFKIKFTLTTILNINKKILIFKNDKNNSQAFKYTFSFNRICFS